MIRNLLPRSFKRFLRERHRAFVFRRAMTSVLRDPQGAVRSEKRLRALVYGWGNEGWSAESEYLGRMVEMAADVGTRQILECGSGLSTLLLAASVAKSGGRLTSLENHADWAERVRSELRRFGLSASATVHDAPLKPYGEFTWYTVGGEDLGPFDSVVCDGPPSATEGGRYGLMPVMSKRLSPSCRILLDDAAREDEQKILERWHHEFGVTYRILGRDKPYAEARVPQ